MWWDFIRNSVVIMVVVLSSCKLQHARPKIFLASSFLPLNDTIKELIIEPVDLVFLSSSAIAKQMEQGAPCEVAVLADTTWRDYLLERGVISPESHVVAHNRLVLAGEVAHNFDDIQKQLEHAEKLIIGDPEFVPLGRYTKEALTNLGLYEKLAPRLLRASSARQATVMLEQKAARLAVLYKSDAQSAGVSALAIDSQLHQPITYPMVVCKTASSILSTKIKNVFKSPQFKERLQALGYN